MAYTYSNTPVVFQVNRSFIINFKNHWKVYFQYNFFEKPVHLKHILFTLCCWKIFGLTYRYLRNPLHSTFSCKNESHKNVLYPLTLFLVSGHLSYPELDFPQINILWWASKSIYVLLFWHSASLCTSWIPNFHVFLLPWALIYTRLW